MEEIWLVVHSVGVDTGIIYPIYLHWSPKISSLLSLIVH